MDAAEGDRQAAVLFREFAKAFKGARQVTYSKGLRDMAPDEALAEPAGELVGAISSAAYRALMYRGKSAQALEAVEREGWGGMLEFLEGEGIDVFNRPTQHAA